MSEMHFNGSSALTGVVYNGTDLDKVYYNNTLVFEKIKSASDTVSYLYYYSSGPSGATFGFKTSSYSLSHSPKKVTSISGGLGNSKWTITGNLTGIVEMPSDSQTASSGIGSFTALSWSISGSTLTITSTSSGSGMGGHVDVNIAYDY